jgi:hypothetical protein
VGDEFEIEEIGHAIELAQWRRCKQLATNTEIGISAEIVAPHWKKENAASRQVKDPIRLPSAGIVRKTVQAHLSMETDIRLFYVAT